MFLNIDRLPFLLCSTVVALLRSVRWWYINNLLLPCFTIMALYRERPCLHNLIQWCLTISSYHIWLKIMMVFIYIIINIINERPSAFLPYWFVRKSWLIFFINYYHLKLYCTNNMHNLKKKLPLMKKIIDKKYYSVFWYDQLYFQFSLCWYPAVLRYEYTFFRLQVPTFQNKSTSF